MLNVKEQSVLLLSKSFESDAYLDEPARLIIRFSSDSVFVKLMQNMAKWGHWQHHMKHAKWQKRGKTLPEAQRTHNLNHFVNRNHFEGGITCIGSKFDQVVVWLRNSSNFCHQVALFALVVSLASGWRYLYCLKMWQTVGASFQLALVTNLATRWHHLHWFQCGLQVALLA